MTQIYDMLNGTIVSENNGVTEVSDHVELPEYGLELQTIHSESRTMSDNEHMMHEYMVHIIALLNDLDPS